MSCVDLSALQESLASLQRKHDVMHTALEFMLKGPPQGAPISEPWVALYLATAQAAHKHLTGAELSDVLIMWRAHLNAAGAPGKP